MGILLANTNNEQKQTGNSKNRQRLEIPPPLVQKPPNIKNKKLDDRETKLKGTLRKMK
jgi:hypothetical protein